MIIQMAKQTVYFPASNNQTTNLPGGSRRIRWFRSAVLVNRKSISNFGVETLAKTGRRRSEHSLWSLRVSRSTPSRAAKRLKRRSPASARAPAADLFLRRRRSAASLALLVHRSLCRSYPNLNAECQPALQSFCFDFTNFVKANERPERTSAGSAKPCAKWWKENRILFESGMIQPVTVDRTPGS